jgi:hypothetical protein
MSLLNKMLTALDNPGVAAHVMDALDEPALVTRLIMAASADGEMPCAHLGRRVRQFLDRASDEQWLQLIVQIRDSADPGLATVRAVLREALPAA